MTKKNNNPRFCLLYQSAFVDNSGGLSVPSYCRPDGRRRSQDSRFPGNAIFFGIPPPVADSVHGLLLAQPRCVSRQSFAAIQHRPPVSLLQGFPQTLLEIPGSAHHEQDLRSERATGHPPAGRETPARPLSLSFTQRLVDDSISAAGVRCFWESKPWMCKFN